jgi:hypothetical protein
MKEAIKTLPIRKVKLRFNGLKPASRGTIEILLRDANPHV